MSKRKYTHLKAEEYVRTIARLQNEKVRSVVIKTEKKAMIYGYARVSTAAQCRDGNNLEDQVAALEKYGCQEIVKEASQARPELQ